MQLLHFKTEFSIVMAHDSRANSMRMLAALFQGHGKYAARTPPCKLRDRL